MTFASRLYAGQVFHCRRRPKVHRLRYSVFSLLLDLDEIDDLQRQLWLFSRNRFNLFSFHDEDFGDGSGDSLKLQVKNRLLAAGMAETPVKVLLSCYPRVLGHAFNPLSLFYCLDGEGRCMAIVHEVHNTFGERHCYVLPVDLQAGGTPRWIHQRADKALFVSPFAQMDMQYDFRLNLPAERQVIVIRASDPQGLLITASYVAHRECITATRLLRCFLVYPLLGAKVVAGIHWEAFVLWCKGVPWFRHQPKTSA
ncbi:DUF1365 domain-containing protein [Granulosicoccus sp. 3-233]|uniref:DUF1365 domain-containing protein n=1 Tax=Granulosicoccus sp. 3-233 TaxID=3417969 RepID=UPI003D35476E